MDFIDSAGTRYQLSEETEAPTPTKKPIWPWVVGGLALAGGLVWMASQTSRSPNPVDPDTEALMAEARDPATSRGRLWALLHHPKVEVRRALLDNPNLCPTKTDGKLDTLLLERLSEEFLEEVANHTAFILHALIEPNEDVKYVVREVAKRTEEVGLIDRIFRTWGPSLGSVRLAVATNSKTPEDILRTLGNPATESLVLVRGMVTRNPSTPVDVLRTLGNEQTESNKGVREAAQKALADRGLT